MSYQGAYQGQYAGFPTYGHGQQLPPQYHASGMQYPAQQQPMQPTSQQMYQTPMNGDIYSKQHYQPQQQRSYSGSQPVQYSPQYPGYQQGQHQRPQYTNAQAGAIYAQTPQAPPAYQSPSPVLQQRSQAQQQQQAGPSAYQRPSPDLQQRQHIQQPQASQYSRFQQNYGAPISPQWPNQPVPASPAAGGQVFPKNVSSSRHPDAHGQVQAHPQRPPPTAQVPKQAAVPASSITSHHNPPSSPDPLAPSPLALRKQQSAKSVQQQSRPSATPVATKPKANVSQTSHTPQQRIASHVEIPVMSQPAKRRRSNEGNAVPVCEGPSVDYQAALLSLSDEYISAAYSLQSLDTDEQLQKYHQLIATGIGCLESVLKNYRHPDARKEARIRLRLATLLIEETENDTEAEETLSKGIALCERSRLTDLKYAMHHLLARLMFKNSHKAAMKAADKLVQETNALQLLHWTYAFRLLRICFGMQVPGHSETAAMLKHLTAMSATAEEHRHISIQITVATIEAMVYLRSGTPDAVDLAQRAMAAARTHQLGAEMASMPQVRALLDCLDLSCSLINFDPAQTLVKMSQMHASLDPATRESGWTKSGSVAIPLLHSNNAELHHDTSGIMSTAGDGTAVLNLRWMTQTGIYVIGYLLSGIVYLHKDEDGKAQSFLREGLKLNQKTSQLQQHPSSLNNRSILDEQHTALDTTARLLIIFDRCGRFEWKQARQGIDQTRNKLAQGASEVSEETTRTLLYLDAMCKQAQGDLQGALDIYQSSDLCFEPDVKLAHVEKDFRVLAALNSIMILRTLGLECVEKARSLHTAVEPYCLDHQNKSFSAAYYMTKATASDSKTAIIKTKQYLHSAVNAARSAANNQLLFVVMNAMTDLFFHGIVGEQAEKSAQASRSLAKKGGDNLWLCVADSMYSEVEERCGKHAVAESIRREGESCLKGLPEALKRSLTLTGTNEG